eukprot:1572307-Rhodomonas_salina.1
MLFHMPTSGSMLSRVLSARAVALPPSSFPCACSSNKNSATLCWLSVSRGHMASSLSLPHLVLLSLLLSPVPPLPHHFSLTSSLTRPSLSSPLLPPPSLPHSLPPPPSSSSLLLQGLQQARGLGGGGPGMTNMGGMQVQIKSKNNIFQYNLYQECGLIRFLAPDFKPYATFSIQIASNSPRTTGKSRGGRISGRTALIACVCLYQGNISSLGLGRSLPQQQSFGFDGVYSGLLPSYAPPTACASVPACRATPCAALGRATPILTSASAGYDATECPVMTRSMPV